MKKAGVSRLFFKVFKVLRVFKDFKEKTSLLNLIAADISLLRDLIADDVQSSANPKDSNKPARETVLPTLKAALPPRNNSPARP